MRYAVISRGLSLSQIEEEIKRVGGKNIRSLPRMKQVFCELEPAQVQRLSQVPGLVVKQTGKVKTEQITWGDEYQVVQATYPGSQASLASRFYQLREAFSPPLTGAGATCCVLDTGIKKGHRALKNKVVYEANFTSSPTADDVFGHGTGVSYMACGGRHAPGEESGIAPGAKVMNLKVLEDDGEGTDESVVAALDHVAELWESAKNKGLPYTDIMFPNMVNMSFGTEDDGDPEHPVKLAVRELYEATDREIFLIAAAGNKGPYPGTIMLPASCPEVFAVGAVTFVPFQVWSRSSRGPTGDGRIKPDVVFYGVDLLLASNESDDSYRVKSGTSFASPAICGGGALVLDALGRFFQPLPSQCYPFGEALDWLENVWSRVSVKASGAPPGKDNDWGYGMPTGDLALKVFAPSGVDMMSQIVVPLFGLGMMSGVVKEMIRAGK